MYQIYECEGESDRLCMRLLSARATSGGPAALLKDSRPGTTP